MLNLLFIMISSSAIGEDVLKIHFLNYEFSDSALREANPPVNAGDLSSVDGLVGWRRATLTAPRVSRDRLVRSWTPGEVELESRYSQEATRAGGSRWSK